MEELVYVGISKTCLFFILLTIINRRALFNTYFFIIIPKHKTTQVSA